MNHVLGNTVLDWDQHLGGPVHELAFALMQWKLPLTSLQATEVTLTNALVYMKSLF